MKLNQRLTHTVLASAVFAFLAMGSSTVMAKQYYKWVDSKGSTHYTTTPPPKTARSTAKKIDTYGYQGSSTPVSQPAPQQNTPTPNQPPQQNQPQNNNNVSPQQQQNEQQHKEANQTLERGANAPS